MPKNEPLTLANTNPSEGIVFSPAVTRVIEKAHRWTDEILRRFEAGETNPIRYYLREANATIAFILGKQANPEDFSHIIELKKRFREQEATNNSYHQKAA